MIPAFEFLGKRYQFAGRPAKKRPDVTVAGWHPDKGFRLHALDGGRQWIEDRIFRRAINRGVLKESSKAPFVWGKNGRPS